MVAQALFPTQGDIRLRNALLNSRYQAFNPTYIPFSSKRLRSFSHTLNKSQSVALLLLPLSSEPTVIAVYLAGFTLGCYVGRLVV